MTTKNDSEMLFSCITLTRNANGTYQFAITGNDKHMEKLAHGLILSAINYGDNASTVNTTNMLYH